MRVTLDAAYPGIIDECCAALEAVFPGKTARRGPRRSSRCVDVSMWSKHWPCFIPQHGPGRKHLRLIRLAAWQKKIIAANHKPFVRGLIHSDGTRIIATERKGSYVRRPSIRLQQQVRGHQAPFLQKLRRAWGPLDPALGSPDRDLPESLRPAA